MSQLTRSEILGRLAARESLRGLNLVRADLTGMGLVGVDLTGANLRMADLTKSDLRDAKLTNAHLSGAVLTEACLVGARMVEASMIGVTMRGVDLSRADVSGADLTGATLDGSRLVGTYLVGAYLNEANLNHADLTGAYIRMAQVAGSNLTGATLEDADLAQADLSGVHLEGSSLLGANLEGASLQGSYLLGCDLRGANLAGADLTGSNLTGARLHGIKYAGVKLDDAWAEWVDLSEDGSTSQRAPLEEAFPEIVAKPIGQVLIEGAVTEDAWAAITAHLANFRLSHPDRVDLRLKSIQQGASSAAMYLEANSEMCIATYFADLVEMVGKGSKELFNQLVAVMGELPSQEPQNGHRDTIDLSLLLEEDEEPPARSGVPRAPARSSSGSDGSMAAVAPARMSSAGGPMPNPDALAGTTLWHADKAFAILTGERKVWFEACSNETLTLRHPHGVITGIDLIRGRFAAERKKRLFGGPDRPSLDEL